MDLYSWLWVNFKNLQNYFLVQHSENWDLNILSFRHSKAVGRSYLLLDLWKACNLNLSYYSSITVFRTHGASIASLNSSQTRPLRPDASTVKPGTSWKGLCLLSLGESPYLSLWITNLFQDAGGMRSISQLKILEQFMYRLNFDTPNDRIEYPYTVFDMIGGTGCGGCVNHLQTLDHCLLNVLQLYCHPPCRICPKYRTSTRGVYWLICQHP